MLERYVNGAIMQHQRVQESIRTICAPKGAAKAIYLEMIAINVHLYLICYDKARNFIESISKIDGDPKLKTLWGTLSPQFEPFRIARNRLEHVDGRLPKTPAVHGDTFVFDDLRCDISAAGLKMLTDAYEEFIRMLSIVDSSGQRLSPEEYAQLSWKPEINQTDN